MQVFEPLS